jgi:hypothetical protein
MNAVAGGFVGDVRCTALALLRHVLQKGAGRRVGDCDAAIGVPDDIDVLTGTGARVGEGGTSTVGRRVVALDLPYRSRATTTKLDRVSGTNRPTLELEIDK